MVKGKVTRNCLVCGHGGSTQESKEEYKEITVCPKCNGAFVDVWCINKYMKDDWKPNEEVQKQIADKRMRDSFDAVSYAVQKYGIDSASSKDRTTTLLTIELEDEQSVPKVFYKGKEITGKRNVFLDWDTDTDEVGGLSYALEYVETAGITKIERRVKGHGFD